MLATSFDITFIGVLLSGTVFGAVVGLPLGAIRATFCARGRRSAAFFQSLLMSWIAATALMFLMWLFEIR